MTKLTPKRFLFEVKEDVVSKLTEEAMKTPAPHPIVRALWTLGALRRTNDPAASNVSRLDRARLWYRGFDARAGILYDFETYDPEDYLSEYERVLSEHVDAGWEDLLGNKLVFHRALEAFDARRPTLYGILYDGRFVPVDTPVSPERTAAEERSPGVTAVSVGRTTTARVDPSPTGDAGAEVGGLLRSTGRLVLKPVGGADGAGVFLFEHRDGAFWIDRERVSDDEFVRRIRGLDGYILCEVAEQAAYAARLYPRSTNTLRMLTLWDGRTGEPFVATTVQRIGTDQSAPVDNFSRGGLSSPVDPETGALGRAARLVTPDRLVWHDTHPDTDEPIVGVRIPHWEGVREAVLEMATALPFVPYIGWDVVVRDDGDVSVIEANHWSDLDLLQIHGPLLTDPRVRRFFRAHHVIGY